MAGLAVADVFTVESFLDGTHYSYVVSMTNGNPVILHMGNSSTQASNGLKLSVQVDTEKIFNYRSAAEELYRFFTHKPNVNIDLDTELVTVGPSTDTWFMTQPPASCYGYGNGNGYHNYVVMAQVAYTIPTNSAINTQGLRNMVFIANTGDVTFNPGRETLSLDIRTTSKLNSMFKDTADEVVAITQQAMALCENDKELFECYHTATKSLPYELNKKVKLLSLASLQLRALVTEEYNFPVRTSCEFDTEVAHSLTLVYKQAHYKNFKEVTHSGADVQSLFTNDHVIVDVKTKFLKRLQALYDRTSVFLWKCTSTRDIEKSVKHAKQYLTAMGLTYKLASNILPDESTITKTKIPREGVYASRITGVTIPHGCKLDSSTLTDVTCLYVKLSNTTPILKSTELFFKDYWSLYRTLTACISMPVVYGVAKKYQSYVDKLTNWVDFETYIEGKIKDTVFHIATDHPNYINQRYIDRVSAVKYPDTVQRHYENVRGYRIYINQNTYIHSSTEELIKGMGATLKKYEPPHPSEETVMLSSYPLTYKLLFGITGYYQYIDSEQAQYIAGLEEHYAVHANQP